MQEIEGTSAEENARNMELDFQDLPKEIQRLIILNYIPIVSVGEVLRARLVCKDWWSILEYECNSFWRDLVMIRFRIPNFQATLGEAGCSPLIDEKKKELTGLESNWRDKFTKFYALKPIVNAIRENDEDAIKKALANGANIDMPYWDSFTVVHHAINVKNELIALYLLGSNFSNINATDIRGETPLHRAAWNDQLMVGRQLLTMGADIESKNFFGYTPLHLAAANGRLDIVKFLLSQGANVNAKSNVGNTPLHRAKCRGHPKVVKFLIQAGSDINIRNDKGKLPSDYTKIVRKNHKLEFT